jgi:sugar/nucleoside kinase (ribokinase family)
LVATDRIQLSMGGCAANVAVSLSRLNIPVRLSGCIGDDSFSSFLASELAHHRLDPNTLRRIEHSGPGTTMMVNVEGHDRRFISTIGANAHYELSDLPETMLEEVGIFYLGGFLMMPNLESRATVDYLRRVRSRGIRTVLDVVLFGDRPYWDAIAPLLPEVDYFMPNRDEAELITGLDDPLEQAKRFLEAGAGAVILTCGEEGTYYVTEQMRLHAGCYSIDFVSGAGSGDAFAAGFISGLLEEASPEDCLKWGSALGASSVRGIGTTESVFTRNEADAFIQKQTLPIVALD